MHQTDGVAKCTWWDPSHKKKLEVSRHGYISRKTPKICICIYIYIYLRQIQILNTVHLWYTGLFSTKKHQKTWSFSRKNHPSTSRWGRNSSFKPFWSSVPPHPPTPKKTIQNDVGVVFPQPSPAETPPCLRVAFVPRAIHGLHQPVKVPCPSRYVARAANP